MAEDHSSSHILPSGATSFPGVPFAVATGSTSVAVGIEFESNPNQ